MPLLYRAARNSALAFHPSYERLIYDESEMQRFVNEHCPEQLQNLLAFPQKIQQIDFFRYLVLYHIGGFYLDLDVFLTKPLDPLCDNQCILAFEELTVSQYFRNELGIDWEAANYAMGSEPRHPLFAAVIENCVRGLRDPVWAALPTACIPALFRQPFLVPFSTGPGMVTRTIAERPDLHASISILFPEDVRESKYWHAFGDYGVHLMHSSWRRRRSFILAKLHQFWMKYRRRHMLAKSALIGPRREGAWKLAS